MNINKFTQSSMAAVQGCVPKNILMIGPTGVGKTEIARRIAKITGSPYTKVEATKYTEVGYVGRDVESMVRDLVDSAVRMVKDQKMDLFPYHQFGPAQLILQDHCVRSEQLS